MYYLSHTKRRCLRFGLTYMPTWRSRTSGSTQRALIVVPTRNNYPATNSIWNHPGPPRTIQSREAFLENERPPVAARDEINDLFDGLQGPCAYLSIHLSVYVSICLCIYLSMYPPIYLPTYLPTNLPTYVSYLSLYV